MQTKKESATLTTGRKKISYGPSEKKIADETLTQLAVSKINEEARSEWLK